MQYETIIARLCDADRNDPDRARYTIADLEALCQEVEVA
ncbi:hypothetical protein Aaci_1071 [Alicyclobacillus acidocaldarius subsp. acidocaldarius DSM 446]|uniref:Uncharacterized protein n=1 Tax=Alicyclobacillus acidocaldarius subsp. acidocaldarius (strain ATCC 27009 / DSM 446 / BCRC 14685 / JCM 5260 / KCTC 1825 / NBRC 15652 / NCIMB 11725 / NRRL B-14509 / 104-IA) TaxID=521098 RepID=C8WVI6_ALIAD|nr:hypothetical protein Aaci_1071 [Alicyclobacillus acidocaldarius subsp. acidocaldarius DSM 446]